MKKLIILSFSLLICLFAVSQKSPKEIKADKYFSRYDYSRAIEKYESLDTTVTINGLRNLAESYRLTFDTEKAEEVYSKLVKKEQVQPDDYYYYAYVLRENEKYHESNNWMLKFKTETSVNDLRVKAFLASLKDLNKIMVNQKQYEIFHLSINTDKQDFGAAYYENEIVFASSRGKASPIVRKWNGNEQPYLDLYSSHVINPSSLESPVPFSKGINDKLNEGPASFNKEGDFMAFTRNSSTGTDKNGRIVFQTFFSTKDEEGNWSEPVAFHENSEEYSIGHPHLSQDGKTMFFASDMPGGYGKADLYKVVLNENGSWGEPTNLGREINTESNDMFPFYQEEEGLLFFSSDGRLGLGGLDVYVTSSKNGYSNVINAGIPINSSADDFSFIVDNKMKHGFFSSNREGGEGDDDIYSFNMLKPYEFGIKVKGVIRDMDENPLSKVSVKLMENDVVVKSTITNLKGEYSFLVDSGKEFKLVTSKSNYLNNSLVVSTSSSKDIINLNLSLSKD